MSRDIFHEAGKSVAKAARVAGWLGFVFFALTAVFLTGCQPAKPADFGFCPCPGCCVVGR